MGGEEGVGQGCEALGGRGQVGGGAAVVGALCAGGEKGQGNVSVSRDRDVGCAYLWVNLEVALWS